MKEFLEKKGISAEDYSKLPAGEALELMNEFNAAKQKALNEAIEAKASKEDIEAMKAEILKQKDAQFDQLQEALKLQGIALKKLTSEEVEGKEVTFKQSLIKFDVKAAGDMSLAGNVTGQVPQALRIAGINDVPSRTVTLLGIVSGGTIGSNLVEWVYQANKDGSAGPTAEGSAKNQIDFDLLVGSQKVEKTTAYITVTDEMLDDVDFIESAINNELTKELLKAVEAGVYSGSGVSPQMNGISTVATAFAAAPFANAIDNANEVDVLTVAINQIMIAQEGSAIPNYILMHPSDVTALKMVKVSSTDKRYVERLAIVGGELSLDGTPIIPTTLVTQGDYLVGDFSKASVLTKQSVSIEVGYNADNFVKNYKTIRAEWRGVTFVKNNDRTAFVKGDFATDKAALETP